jgi:hypothetical protein
VGVSHAEKGRRTPLKSSDGAFIQRFPYIKGPKKNDFRAKHEVSGTIQSTDIEGPALRS